MKKLNIQQPVLRELEGGLILRRSSPADAAELADFCARIHSDDGPDKPDPYIAAWARDLVTKPHPTFHPDDFTIVAEAASGRIVSALNLIPQTWTYEGIPFNVGRPELVGTLPEYRNRGLIRLQFAEIHRWSRERGDRLQAITGIPFYYRLLGYEMALDLSGRRFGYAANVPALKEGETEPVIIRPAVRSDLPFVAGVYAQAQKRYEIACRRGVDILEYELEVQSPGSANHFELMMIESPSGEPLGYFQRDIRLWDGALFVMGYELKEGISWLKASPALARYLCQKGPELAALEGLEFKAFGFLLGQRHPVYDALGPFWLPASRDPYAWYLRVEDLPGFIRHIAPALEQRLAESIAVGFSGEIRLSFYRDGLRMEFEAGRLKQVESWEPKGQDNENAAFPGLTFLQMLFGYRSFDELEQSFADCSWKTWQDRLILDILFPKRLSDVFAVA